MKQTIKILILMVLGFISLGEVSAVTKADILGTWVNQAGDGLIEITLQQEKYSGTIMGGTDGEDRKDINNPDPALRDRSLLGVKILGDLFYRENNMWAGGWIYDPNNGKTYKCKMKLTDSKTLEIRGYVGISAFGRTEIWKKKDE